MKKDTWPMTSEAATASASGSNHSVLLVCGDFAARDCRGLLVRKSTASQPKIIYSRCNEERGCGSFVTECSGVAVLRLWVQDQVSWGDP